MHDPLSATRRVALTATLAAFTLGLAGCGTSSSASGADTATSAASALTLEDGWVKALDVPSPGASPMPMTAMFGTLHNPTGSEVTVSGGSSPAAGALELHEVIRTESGTMHMQPKPGGFVIAAGTDHTLQPGGDHVMLMGVTESLVNGSDVAVTLQTSAGEVTFTVPVRTFSGGEESYAPSPDTSGS